MRTPTRKAFATAAAVFLLTGCGALGDDSEADGAGGETAEVQTDEEALLDFAACMRDNGIDMPDPDEEDIRIALPGGDEDEETLMAATEECEDLLPVDEDAPSEEEMFEESLRIAECMRENGIDVDDPEPGQGLALPAEDDEQSEAVSACVEEHQGAGEAESDTEGDS